MLKRIWAVVSDPDFYAFQQRAKKEGMDMGAALASIVHIYAMGHDVKHADVAKHKDQLDYLKARDDNSSQRPHLSEVQG